MSDLLAQAGAALYGPRWQSEMARDLGINPRTVRRWASGKSAFPFWARYKIRDMLDERIFECVWLCNRIIPPELD